ncbi:hypothetical protein, partial [Xanthovirga aplysinae]|uniref:hypothetical protein n=1 Tax=Xanthovirga aplysinae TaxID=2529853 RepID=UPI0012BC38DA
MKIKFNNGVLKSKKWELDNISIAHTTVHYHTFGSHYSKNDSDFVRLHFGLSGDYRFHYRQLNASFNLSGPHNNIMYSKGLELEVLIKSKRIETFGVNFKTSSFLDIAQNGNDSLKRLAEKVERKENSILSSNWKPKNFKIEQVINEIINCSFT